jgi:hypothetical protein
VDFAGRGPIMHCKRHHAATPSTSLCFRARMLQRRLLPGVMSCRVLSALLPLQGAVQPVDGADGLPEQQPLRAVVVEES